MVLDHLLFNKLKWFNVADNADSMTANSRDYYACPKSFTINKGANLGNILNNAYESYASEDTSVTCIGAGTNYYFFTGEINTYSSDESYTTPAGFATDNVMDFPGHVRKSDVKNINWGGRKGLLAHVYQAIASLFRRAVIA